MSKGKYLALDYGDARVGVALSDLNKEIAFPRESLRHRGARDLIRQIETICGEESVIKIVLGLPIQMDGTWGERAKKTEQFAEKLRQALPAIPVQYFDERLTTIQAEAVLRQKGLKPHQQKGHKDAVAAQKILEGYLVSQR